MTDRICPECSSTLARNASYCGCGWGKQKKGDRYPPSVPRVPCAFDSCARRAVVKVRVGKTSWSDLCLEHDQQLAQKRANEYCASLGLKTVAEKIKWVKGRVNLKLDIRALREPGEDEAYQHSEVEEAPL